jgi:hypothetical protein
MTNLSPSPVLRRSMPAIVDVTYLMKFMMLAPLIVEVSSTSLAPAFSSFLISSGSHLHFRSQVSEINIAYYLNINIFLLLYRWNGCRGCLILCSAPP